MLIATCESAATKVRPPSARENRARIGISGWRRSRETGTAGSAPACAATSASIFASVASASSSRPRDSSQRGDSGICLRRIQTPKAPIPASTNITRQLNCGIRK